jgi:hypothetical protein
MKRLTTEQRWVLLFALGVSVLTSLPYLIANLNGAGVFTGFLIGVEDGNSYIAKMLAGAYGDWLFNSPYTAMSQAGALIYLPYLLLGKLLGQGGTHGAFVFAFHAFRVIAIFLLSFASYDFISHLVSKIHLRRLGLALALLGGGLGWALLFFQLSPLFGSIPLDFYSPETFGFLANFTLPHLVLARALMLWALLLYMKDSKTAWWKIALLWLAMALVHLITAGLALGLMFMHTAYAGWQSRSIKTSRISSILPAMIAVGIVAAPNLWLLWKDPYLRIWAAQNQILSPNPLHYIFAFGWLVPFVYFGLRDTLKNGRDSGIFALLWLVALPVLLYLPFGLQRRLAEGAWVLLTALALRAFQTGYWAKRPRDLWLFSLAFPSTVILLVGAMGVASSVASPAFRSPDEVAIFEDVRSLVTPKENILSSYEVGNALPAWAPVRVLVGHGPEGVDQEEMIERITAFFKTQTPDDVRLEFLARHTVSYVFWGPIEDAYGSWDPSEASYMEVVASHGEYALYRVSQEAIE